MLGNCDWERTSTGVRCTRDGCGNRLQVAADYPLERIHATCWALDPERKGLKEEQDRRKEVARRYQHRDTYRHPCRYQGANSGRQAECRGCGGTKKFYDLYDCDVYGECLPHVLAEGFHVCRLCDEYESMED